MRSHSTLDEIAQQCGVSKNTVSAILRLRPGYAARTVERVQAAAAALNYTPNPMVSALMRSVRHSRPGKAQGNLAYFVSETEVAHTKQPFDGVLVAAARERAATLGFELDLIPIDTWRSRSTALDRMLRSRNIEGVIVGPLGPGRKHLTLNWSCLSAVALGFSLIRPDLHRVATNQYHVMAIAFRALRHLGYRRIGVCLRPALDARFDHAWQAGLGAVQFRLPPVEYVPPLICPYLDTAMFSQWFRDHKPDVVVSAGHSLWHHLKHLKLRVPADVGLVNLTETPGPQSAATVARDWPALGAAATDLLVAMLLRNEKGLPAKPTRTLLNGNWHPGTTVREVPRSCR